MRYFFEDYVLNTDRRELHRGADVVPIAPQVFDLLDYLIRSRERVVSKDDLINAIWNGRSVSDAALTTRLNAARTAIGDSGNEQRLIKTLPRKGFRFVGQVREVAGSDSGQATAESALSVLDKPSIAVLPFENMSGDPEQEYFADGMVDEITTALSRFRSLFVIARNSSFSYKGKAVDIKQVGRELGVRYVLEGSVRKAAGKVRIIGQLIDVATGVHLWADRFEGDLSDVFTLQDRMTESVIAAIEPRVFQAEVDLAARRPNSLSAYDLCLRAIPHLYSFTRDGSAEALRLVSRALEIDPRYGFAATLAGSCHIQKVTQGWATDPKSEFAEGLRLLRLVLSIDGNDHLALSMLSYAAAWSGDFGTAREMVDRAIISNPNAAFAWSTRGWTCRMAGDLEEAIRSFERAVLLSPFDPLLFVTLTEMGVAFIDLGRFDEAVVAAKKALSQTQSFLPSYCCLITALAHLGREAEAKESATRLLELKSDFRISEWVSRSGLRTNQMFVDGLRKAGIPE
ncbi:tetratricopeptide repeat protein [Bradyrhizobium sp. Arg68]|uniref:winged helix-turn-helix domain-containing tetratricopeptide repeat protein n=1 Tax=Bradyrhizobium ivorense TaxID=2511166 RepID=UPI001E38FACA|nr:tetratricopeptide repeat protein [Bradyrhizobium ivorense]MCC8940595.1 tetratricopeptide repeat protein [Bradyrhizobium ivorense]